MARYLDAASRVDIDTMVALTQPDFEFRTPRAVVRGHDQLRALLSEPRSLTVSFIPERWFASASGEQVVCHLVSRFGWPETGEAAGEEPGFVRAVLDEGRIRLVQVYEDGRAALDDAGLGEADERRAPQA